MKLKYVLLFQTIGRFCTPEKLQVGRKYLFSLLRMENFIDGCRITDIGIANKTQSIVRQCLQHSKQRMLFLGCLNLCITTLSCILCGILIAVLQLQSRFLGCSCFFGTFSLGSIRLCVGIGQVLIELSKIWIDFLVVVGFPEFKVCTTLQKLTHTFRLANTWHFNH